MDQYISLTVGKDQISFNFDKRQKQKLTFNENKVEVNKGL